MSTGILPICKDEQGLAAVLGHGEQDLLFNFHVNALKRMSQKLDTLVSGVLAFLARTRAQTDFVSTTTHSREDIRTGRRICSCGAVGNPWS